MNKKYELPKALMSFFISEWLRIFNISPVSDFPIKVGRYQIIPRNLLLPMKYVA